MLTILLLGLGVGIMAGLMGVGGGIVLVPALVYLSGVVPELAPMDQHMAQGTSLLLQLPPVGIGALYLYWKKGNVDWRAGLVCAAGFLAGGYFGSLAAIGITSEHLRALFGLFLMVAAVLMLRQSFAPEAGQGNG